MEASANHWEYTAALGSIDDIVVAEVERGECVVESYSTTVALDAKLGTIIAELHVTIPF